MAHRRRVTDIGGRPIFAACGRSSPRSVCRHPCRATHPLRSSTGVWRTPRSRAPTAVERWPTSTGQAPPRNAEQIVDGDCRRRYHNAMSARDQARADFLAIRRAMLAIGRPATAQELAEVSGLPLVTVSRRLQANGTGNMTAEFAWFKRGEAEWGLTEVGREVRE